jgi:hypothetical protein
MMRSDGRECRGEGEREALRTKTKRKKIILKLFHTQTVTAGHTALPVNDDAMIRPLALNHELWVMLIEHLKLHPLFLRLPCLLRLSLSEKPMTHTNPRRHATEYGNLSPYILRVSLRRKRKALTMRRSLTSRSLSLYRSALQRPFQPFLFTSRAITDRSFAADELTKAGVKLEKAADEPIVHVTQEMINTPNERVRKLVDEVLNLNLMEIGMFFQAIQVLPSLSSGLRFVF